MSVHRCCYAGCTRTAEGTNAYCPHHRSLIRGWHGRQAFAKQCGTTGCAGQPYGARAIYCVDCQQKRMSEPNMGNGNAKANGKRRCKCGCGRVITERNQSGLAKPCYDRLASRRVMTNHSQRRTRLWQAGLLEFGMIGIPRGDDMRPTGIAIGEPMFEWDGFGRRLRQ